jgi:hypothetical protein
MQITVALVPSRSRQPCHETVAWFVPGGNAHAWLCELNRGVFPWESIELYPVPASFNTTEPIGVIATIGSGSCTPGIETSLSTTSSGRLRPYGRIANRLFIPTDAQFDPELTEADLISLLPDDSSDYVWHPSTGLVRIEATECLRITDLLTPPLERSGNWTRAVAGVSFRSRLISVDPEVVFNDDDVIQQGADDIGSMTQSGAAPPPTPDEWFGGKLNQWTKPLRDAAKSLVSRKGNQPRQSGVNPGSQSGRNAMPGPFGALKNTVATMGQGLAALGVPLAAIGSAMGKLLKGTGIPSFVDQVARNREVDRLMSLLQTDPDEGLRYAVSFGGRDQHRGRANPSNQLGARDTKFSVDRLAGGGPADFWNLQADQYHKLIQKYRELAEREIRIGRHRRAAYIYAELLGDDNSAAGALERGGHWREAAILYRDRLKRPVNAAGCLERAGLLDEAALLYIELNMLEEAARLYVLLDRNEDAEHLFRQLVDQLIAKNDFRNASRILHDKLRDIDGALDVLAQGWPSSSTAQQCLEESFVLLGLHSRHKQAGELIGRVQSERAKSHMTAIAAKVLSQVANDFADDIVRKMAADATRVLVSHGLMNARSGESTDLLSSLQRLAPQDRLLTRDCDRYVRMRQKSARNPLTSQKRPRGIQSLFKTSLLMKIDWRVAKSAGNSVYVAGYRPGTLVLKRLEWSHLDRQDCQAVWVGVSDLSPLILDPFPDDAGPAILHQIDAEPLVQKRLTYGKEKWAFAGSPVSTTKFTKALCYDPIGQCWEIRIIQKGFELIQTSLQGDRIPQFGFSVPLQQENDRYAIDATNGKPRFGIGSQLCRECPSEPRINHYQFEGVPVRIQDLLGCKIGSLSYLLVLSDVGGLLIDEEHGLKYPIAEDLEGPCAVFLRGGLFVVAGSRAVAAYEIKGSGLAEVGTARLDFAPISITRTPKLNSFAAFGAGGEIQLFDVDL